MSRYLKSALPLFLQQKCYYLNPKTELVDSGN